MSVHNHDEDIIKRLRQQTENDKNKKTKQESLSGCRGGSKWCRYRFFTKSVEDYRPLIFNPKYPWWCSGESADGSSATIIAYLPQNEELKKYWDDAYGIEVTEHNTIEFSDRFPKPSYYQE